MKSMFKILFIITLPTILSACLGADGFTGGATAIAKKKSSGDGAPSAFSNDGLKSGKTDTIVAGGGGGAAANDGTLNDGTNPGSNGGASTSGSCTRTSTSVAFGVVCEENTEPPTATGGTGTVPKTTGSSTAGSTTGSSNTGPSTAGSTTGTSTTGSSTGTVTGGTATAGSTTGSTSGVCSKPSGTEATVNISSCFNQIVKAAGIKSINIAGLPNLATATFHNCILPSSLATYVAEIDSSGNVVSAPNGLPATDISCGAFSCTPGDSLDGSGILANSCIEAD